MDYLLHHTLRSNAERLPDKDALIHGERRLGYQQVYAATLRLAGALQAQGLKRGDRAGIFLDPSIPQVISIYGVSQAGGVFVPINGSLFPQQVTHIVNDCKIKALIISRDKLDSLEEVLDQMPSLEFAVITGAGDQPSVKLRHVAWEQAAQESRVPEIRDAGIGKDLAAILYTSGSTGKPKGVMLSHANLLAGADIVSDYLGITEQERILAVLPFSFDAGLNQLTSSFLKGSTLVLINFVFAREIVQTALKERITGLAGVPTLWSLLVQGNSTLDRHPLPDLRYITNTGGAMPQNVLARLRRLLPSTRIFLMYGLTEAFRSTYLPPEELDRRPTSMGKAIPDTEILVIDETGRRCGPGETGELVHRGPTVSMGYWGRPDDTARVLRPNPLLPPELGDCERVCYSGDLVRMDEEGFLYFVGRRDTLIKSSGFRISPTEVEEALFSSGILRGAAVIGVQDEILGQAIKAFVVLRAGEQASAEDLISHCSHRLPRHMLPKYIEFVDELPKTTSGKVDYPALRNREATRLVSSPVNEQFSTPPL